MIYEYCQVSYIKHKGSFVAHVFNDEKVVASGSFPSVVSFISKDGWRMKHIALDETITDKDSTVHLHTWIFEREVKEDKQD